MDPTDANLTEVIGGLDDLAVQAPDSPNLHPPHTMDLPPSNAPPTSEGIGEGEGEGEEDEECVLRDMAFLQHQVRLVKDQLTRQAQKLPKAEHTYSITTKMSMLGSSRLRESAMSHGVLAALHRGLAECHRRKVLVIRREMEVSSWMQQERMDLLYTSRLPSPHERMYADLQAMGRALDRSFGTW